MGDHLPSPACDCPECRAWFEEGTWAQREAAWVHRGSRSGDCLAPHDTRIVTASSSESIATRNMV